MEWTDENIQKKSMLVVTIGSMMIDVPVISVYLYL